MSKTFTIIFQVLAMVLQFGSALTDLVTPKWKPLVAGLLGILQAIQGTLAHYYNPDGTPATAPYVAPK